MKKLSTRWTTRLLTVNQKRDGVTCFKDDLKAFKDHLQAVSVESTGLFAVVSSVWTKHGYTTYTFKLKSHTIVEFPPKTAIKKENNRSFSRENYGDNFSGFSSNNLRQLFRVKFITGAHYVSLLDCSKTDLKENILWHIKKPFPTRPSISSFLCNYNSEIIRYLPHSLVLAALRLYYLFPRMKKCLAGQRYCSNEKERHHSTKWRKYLPSWEIKLQVLTKN